MLREARSRYLALAGLAIVVGLFVHLRGAALGPVVRDVLGDALWAAMITWLVAALVPQRLYIRIAAAYAWCVAVELSQLYHAPGFDAIRATRLGHLVLGSGFDARDLVAYALGVAGAVLVELALGFHKPRRVG